MMKRPGRWHRAYRLSAVCLMVALAAGPAWAQAVAGAEVRVVGQVANVRAEPSPRARVLFQVRSGDVLRLLDTQGDWLQVETADGRRGYLFKALGEVKAPPPPAAAPPPPPPPPPPSMGGGGWSSGGGSSGGGGRDDNDAPPRGPIQIPSDCVVLPGTNYCHVPVGCQPGGDISGCTGRFMQAPSGGRRAVAVAAGAKARKLLKPVKLRIPAGQTRRVKLQLTRAGRAQLMRRGRVRITVLGEVRAGGRVIASSRRKVVFKLRRR
jgi:hypothetical protein